MRPRGRARVTAKAREKTRTTFVLFYACVCVHCAVLKALSSKRPGPARRASLSHHANTPGCRAGALITPLPPPPPPPLDLLLLPRPCRRPPSPAPSPAHPSPTHPSPRYCAGRRRRRRQRVPHAHQRLRVAARRECRPPPAPPSVYRAPRVRRPLEEVLPAIRPRSPPALGAPWYTRPRSTMVHPP